MSEVADLFAKKKKKGKKKKGDKSKKVKSSSKTTKKTTSDAADPGAATTAAAGGWTSTTTQYKSILGAKKPAKLKKKLAVEQTEEDVKFQGMTESEYNKHVDQDTSKKDFHKARMLADAKAKMSSDKPEAVKPIQAVGWRAKMEQRQQASSTNIRNQLGNASHFPSLGGRSSTTSSFTSTSADGGPTPGAPKAPSGAWGALAEDEEIKKEVAAVLHDQDPEVIKQRELEAARQRKIEQEKKDTWKPTAEEGGINKDIEDSFIERKVHSMIEEYLNVGDINEVILCIKEFRNPAKHGLVLQRIFEEAFEVLGDESQLGKIATLIVALRKNKAKTQMGDFKGTGFILTKGQMVDTISFLAECMEDIKVDVPQAPERFEFICNQLKIKQVLPGLEKAFIPSASFDGAKDGYDFKAGASGTGYYLQKDAGAGGAKSPPAASSTSSKPDPFGGAAPVTTKTRADPFGGAAPVTTKTRADPFGGAAPVTTKNVSKPDPFGGAKPVKKKVDPFGGAAPVTTKTRADPFGGAKPVKKKVDPFGGAKPVDQGGDSSTAMYGKKKKKKKKGGYVA